MVNEPLLSVMTGVFSIEVAAEPLPVLPALYKKMEADVTGCWPPRTLPWIPSVPMLEVATTPLPQPLNTAARQRETGRAKASLGMEKVRRKGMIARFYAISTTVTMNFPCTWPANVCVAPDLRFQIYGFSP